jgi:hypothetical protein
MPQPPHPQTMTKFLNGQSARVENWLKAKNLTRPPRRVRRMLKAIQGRYRHFDVLELYLNSAAPDLPLEMLNTLCGGGVFSKPSTPQYQAEWKCKLVMLQPSPEALVLLLASLGSHRVLITKVEVTLDLRVESEKFARKLKWALLKMMAVKSWRQLVLCHKETIYFGRGTRLAKPVPSEDGSAAEVELDSDADMESGDDEVNQGRKAKGRAAPRNYVIYSRLGKPGGPWEEKHCLRLEARFRGKPAIEGIGITTVQCLIDFDHAQFWLDRVRLLVPPSQAEVGARFGPGEAEVSRTMLTKRGKAWRRQFLVEGHFCLQNAVLAHRELWSELDSRWTQAVLLGT